MVVTSIRKEHMAFALILAALVLILLGVFVAGLKILLAIGIAAAVVGVILAFVGGGRYRSRF